MNTNYPRLPFEVSQAKIETGMKHIRFACRIYRSQLRRGKHFLHEHPESAFSWKTREIKRMLRHPGVSKTKMDQCRYGLEFKDKDGVTRPCKKPTVWMSSSPQMLEQLGKVCQRDHEHTCIMGSDRISQAA